jgi:hypothetical protein
LGNSGLVLGERPDVLILPNGRRLLLWRYLAAIGKGPAGHRNIHYLLPGG